MAQAVTMQAQSCSAQNLSKQHQWSVALLGMKNLTKTGNLVSMDVLRNYDPLIQKTLRILSSMQG